MSKPVDPERLAAFIKRTVDAAPPLTDEQRDRIAAALAPRRMADVLPAPDETTARRILATLNRVPEQVVSEPLHVEVKP